MRVEWVQHKGYDGERAVALLERSASSNVFTNGGPLVARLESEIRDRLGIADGKAVVATSSGTGALWAAKAAMDVVYNRSLRFATQAFTFPSSAQGYLADSLVLDVDEGGGPSLAEADAVRDRIDGLIVTNVFGRVADIARYSAWCKDNGKLLLLDNAATPLTVYRGTNSLNHGDAAICSLHHTKTLGFGEGGFVVCDGAMEMHVRRSLNFGIDNGSIKPEWNRFGGNYKMSELAAAGILQFWDREFDGAVRRNREVFDEFVLMRPDAVLYPSHHDPGTTPVHLCIPVLLPRDSSETVRALNDDGVMARRYYNPLSDGPRTARFYSRIACVPCHAGIETAQVYGISKHIPTEYSVRNCDVDRNESGVEASARDRASYPFLRGFVGGFVRHCFTKFEPGRVLHVAPQDHGVCPGAEADTLDLDPDSGCTFIADITRDNSELIPAGTYDTVICTEVLEHTSDPFAALGELCRVTRAGGRAVITVPCDFRMHGPLPDSWRFTEHGIRLMAERCGFRVAALLALESAQRSLFPIDYGAVLVKR